MFVYIRASRIRRQRSYGANHIYSESNYLSIKKTTNTAFVLTNADRNKEEKRSFGEQVNTVFGTVTVTPRNDDDQGADGQCK